ncbi:NmrA/HSCARG family protein [Nocardia cyriacigeorgica]|uniref:NmrA/HSCARG family protein n=1 Tax=Nocardia cyriacigeorgica TaxID=135487 RepID=UPI001894B549|nr:NmrA/HSCARG family protein [Nocardia cyriacigeorgica]MBF6090200.1 NmrA/HSCARG family protein [Nocardia cyriacigeorgica]MBF6094723.1 NmrA/HSCARG family protein [Nocardia cyriacigeorgica]MBF6098647.1 NmrA/HSCARG family protein [Nocardia cyriacigeorgica]MBF6162403.1 NmrA/HSCARG family protein [Nocardia cyriacigeorgica]MBF6201362.1 NmrA/HSCARG family protein [Nocardia cyriacigeorgica]
MFTIAVTGATGAQGGATARALLARGHHVRALTRSPESPAAVALGALGAQIRYADFDNPESLDAALSGADSLFAVTTPFDTDTTIEIRHGKALVDAAATAGVDHIVFTSAAHADRDTGVPHYDSKFAIEQHLRTSGVPWSILGPAAFMDNYATGWTLDSLRAGTFAWPMPADQPLTLICAEDIGAFAALALDRRGEFLGRRVDIAGDELTPAQIAATLAAVLATPVAHQEVPLDDVRSRSADLAAMFEYFTTVGLDVDFTGLRSSHPDLGWHRFADWAARQDWPTLFAAASPSH